MISVHIFERIRNIIKPSFIFDAETKLFEIFDFTNDHAKKFENLELSMQQTVTAPIQKKRQI